MKKNRNINKCINLLLFFSYYFKKINVKLVHKMTITDARSKKNYSPD